ncbi:unnamed protein product, partial [Rotaria socialis]
EYAQNEILISPKSPRTTSNRYHTKKVTTPISINKNKNNSTTTTTTTTTTNSNSNNININNNQQNDDIPLLTSDSNKFPSSNLNP